MIYTEGIDDETWLGIYMQLRAGICIPCAFLHFSTIHLSDGRAPEHVLIMTTR